MSNSIRTLMLISWSAALTAGPPVLAQHGHGEGEEHGKRVEFKMPTTYKAAVKEIQYRLHEIAELIEARKLDQVHAQADVIQKVGKELGQLALRDGSGVPKEAVRDINLAGKDLAARFDAIDKAGDSGDLAGTKKAYEGMVAVAATLQKYAGPATYSEAVEEIEHGLGEIAELIETNNLSEVHAEANEVQAAATMIGQLASMEGSGVPKEAVRVVSAAADDLAAKCEAIEEACEARNSTAAKKLNDDMVRVASTLQKYVSAVYQCPMKCEGDKTYGKPGKCPKCGMELKTRT